MESAGKCRACEAEVSHRAKVCPHCGCEKPAMSQGFVDAVKWIRFAMYAAVGAWLLYSVFAE